MDARAEAEKRYPHEVWMVTADDIGWVDSERDAFVAGAVWALREAADFIRGLVPEDIFLPLDAEDHRAVTAAIRKHTITSRDSVSADVYRKVASILDTLARADEIEAAP